MNPLKADLLDRFASPKVLYGPSSTPEGRAAMSALKADPRWRALRERLAAVGFFRPAPLRLAWRAAWILAVIGGGWLALVLSHDPLVRALACVAVGFTVVQASFLVHEAAHGAMSKRGWLVELVGQLYDTVLVGYDFAYFRRSHDLHHFHTNEERLDPDGLSDLFSVNPWSVAQKRGLGRVITRLQGALIPVLYTLWAFAMKWDGITFVWRNRRKHALDAAMLLVHVAVWLVVPILVAGPRAALVHYAAWNVVAGIYLAVIIPVNHVGMPTFVPGAAPGFLEQQVTSSRNLVGPRRLHDFLFIGLNRQIEHHLFPFVPTPRLHLGAKVVKAWCAEHGLPYPETTYLAASADVYRHLARMGRLARASEGSSAASAAPGKTHIASPIASSGLADTPSGPVSLNID